MCENLKRRYGDGMSKWIQLTSTQFIKRKKQGPGDWVYVGSQLAEQLVADGLARYSDDVAQEVAQVVGLPTPPVVKSAGPPIAVATRMRTKRLAQSLKTSAKVDPNLKVAVGMIVFNGDHILEGVLDCVYPWASQICIAEGPVKFHADRLSVETSTDNTVDIIRSFPDPDKKINLVQGVWDEKLAMCNAWIEKVKPDTHYVWQYDSDEMYRQEHIERVLSLLGPDGYDSVAFRFRSFYGGFERHMIGWEEAQPTHRIKRFYPDAKWITHRPPTIYNPETNKPWRERRHLTHWEVDAAAGVRIFHYSFVFPSQAEMKYQYYDHLTKGAIVKGGFKEIYLPWATGDDAAKAEIEQHFQGVHHLRRGPSGQCVCHTVKYGGQHPAWIENHRGELEARIQKELEQWA